MRARVVLLGLASLLFLTGSIISWAGGWRGNFVALGIVFAAQFAFLTAYAALPATSGVRWVAVAFLGLATAMAAAIAFSVRAYIAMEGNILQPALAAAGLIPLAFLRPTSVRAALFVLAGALVLQMLLAVVLFITGGPGVDLYLALFRSFDLVAGLACVAATIAEARAGSPASQRALGKPALQP